MGIKNFIKKILSSKKEPKNKLTNDKKEKIIREVKNNDDGSKSIKLKQQGGKEVSSNINISFGGDHRVLNGATVARFVKRWKE